MKQVRITKLGRKRLNDDTAMSAEMRLLLEITKRAGDAKRSLIEKAFDQALLICGDAEAAIVAIKSGEININIKGYHSGANDRAFSNAEVERLRSRRAGV